MPPANALRAAPSPDAVSDADLVARALRGDQWAQAAIYQRHAPRLLNTTARLLGSRADALDVVHEVFVDALEGLDGLRDPAALGAWLLKRTVNKASRRHLRQRVARAFGLHHGPELSLATLAMPGVSPEVRAELERISAVLEGLPSRQRFAWVLHHVEGETLPAVAEVAGVSLATIKRDIAAAQARIEAQTRSAT